MIQSDRAEARKGIDAQAMSSVQSEQFHNLSHSWPLAIPSTTLGQIDA